MNLLKVSHKGINMDSQKKCHIYKSGKFKHILNEQHITDLNTLFDSVIKKGDLHFQQQGIIFQENRGVSGK
jgi:hypothetical protein